MIRKAWVAMTIAVALMAPVAGTAAANTSKGRTVRTDAETLAVDKIVLVGDSTMAAMSGWASMFCAHHVKSSTACLNLGRGGRSTRSYRQEGSWDLALAEARVPGYRRTFVLIQFGHNDQSSVAERWTEMDTEFPANLRRMIEEVRRVGAVPVLLTPLARRDFVNGRLNNTLEPWSSKIRAVAAALKVPLVDLNAASAAVVQEMGPLRSMALAQTAPSDTERRHAETGTTLKARPAADARLPDVPTTPDGPRGQFQRKFDYTHLGDEGAELFAGLVARDLARAVPELQRQLAP